MKVVIPGGSGHVGGILARSFSVRGEEAVVLSRRPYEAPWRVVQWDGVKPGSWTDEIDGCDVVINLAGRSVNCRYNEKNRREILDSRILSTRAVGSAIATAVKPPRLWLQASTATIYAHRYDAPNDEPTGVIGGHEPDAPKSWRFSIEVATAWEAAANEVELPHTRLILLRSALIMSRDRGGVFDTIHRLVRLGLGGQWGDGRQFVSWIHHQDFARALQWLIEHEEVAGAINIAAPHPLPNAKFMRVLRASAGVPVGLPATSWMLELGTLVVGSESELLLKSRRVIPTRLLASGFEFRYPDWPAAAADLCMEA